jgi:hypothetical protein
MPREEKQKKHVHLFHGCLFLETLLVVQFGPDTMIPLCYSRFLVHFTRLLLASATISIGTKWGGTKIQQENKLVTIEMEYLRPFFVVKSSSVPLSVKFHVLILRLA